LWLRWQVILPGSVLNENNHAREGWITVLDGYLINGIGVLASIFLDHFPYYYRQAGLLKHRQFEYDAF